MGEVKIKVENLTKIFGNKPEQGLELLNKGMSKNEIMDKTGQAVGVNNATFEVEEGQFLVIMGLSGSGKSTLVRLINRLIEPTTGSVIIDGNDITKMNSDELRNLRRKKFAMVFQRFALFPHRTILKNVEFGLEIQGMEQSEREQKAREALDLVGLKGWEESFPEQLSGGMQQRVGLARALAVDPDILLMDEAFSALDPLIKKEMQDELLALQNRVNKTIIFITHDLDEALKLGDKIILMKDGAIVQEGTPEDILTNPADEYVEKFVEDVNTSKILTASGVMKKVKNVAYPKDGPRTVLRKMEEEGISSIFVVNRDGTLNGIVSAEDAAEAAENGVKEITNIIKRDVIQIDPDTPVNEIFPVIATAAYPIVVADENKKLLGIIIKGTILAKLAGKGVK
jgi:glycine betaine/proline transport system ATP-binding protein